MGQKSPSFLDGRDAHPTRTIKIVSYLILIPYSASGDARTIRKNAFYKNEMLPVCSKDFSPFSRFSAD